MTFIEEEALISFGPRKRKSLEKCLLCLRQLLVRTIVSQRLENEHLYFTSASSLSVRLRQPVIEQVESCFCFSLRDAQADNDERLPLLLNKAKVLTELCYRSQPSLHRGQIRDRKLEACLFRQNLPMEIQPSAFQCQDNQFLQQVLCLCRRASSVQYTGQHKRTGHLNKLFRVILANLIHAMLPKVERLGHFLLRPLQFIPLIGERSETDQRIRHVKRVFCGLGKHLPVELGCRVQLSLPETELT